MFTNTNAQDMTRKRKQADDKLLSSSMPTTTSSWSDFIYSSPSSPSTAANGLHVDDQHHFNFDSFFEQHHTPLSGSNSRRHSVAVGEMDYHSFDMQKDMNIMTANEHSPWDDIQMLLNSTAHMNPTTVSATDNERPIHRRTLSLREDDPHYATLLSPALSTASSNFFSTSFLDALVAENASTCSSSSPTNNLNDASTIISDMSFMDSTHSTHSNTTGTDLFNLNNSIPPSAITNEINTMADWLLEQQEVKEMHTQAQKRQRRSTNSLSPVSPSNTMGSSSLSSMSPSPPITPMQPASLGFEPIPFGQQQQQQQQQVQQQEDWDIAKTNNSKSGLITARIIQGETTASSLKPLIQDYLIRRDHQERSLPVTGERTVMVLTSRVAQKSYGTEKRFLCPPPTTILKGANWWTNSSNGNNTLDKPNLLSEPKKASFFQSPSQTLSSPKLTIHISGETINQTGVLEWSTANGTIVDTAACANTSVSGRCVSKQLYINDADEKRKRVEVLAKIQLGNGLQLGTFPSKGIKVISKPSKKRQSIKNMELCIHHGTTISLFNRIRSQTVSTKYLGVSNGQPPANNNNTNSTNNAHKNNAKNNGTCFVARTGSWDPFVIWIVDTTRSPDANAVRPNAHHPNNPNFPPPPAIALQTPSSTQQPVAIHYNQPVVLQCVTTGLVSPVMVIRKVDKGSMVLGGNRMDDLSGKTGGECGDETLGDPVSQLHKIAFQIVQDPTFSHQNKARYQQQQQQQPPAPVKQQQSNYKIPQSCHPVTYLACLNDVVGMHKTTYTRHLVPNCQSLKVEASNNNNNTAVWNDLMQNVVENKLFDAEECKKAPNTTTTTATGAAARRRMSSISSTESKVGRRGSLAERRGSSVDALGLEGACWTEDVSDAAVWTIVGTDCASYTFWTPSDAPDQSCFNMPFNQQATTTLSTSSAPITPFPILQDIKQSDCLTLSGENLTRDLNLWFGDIKAPHTEYKSRESMVCTIPDIQELLSSPTLIIEEEGLQKKIPLLLVRGDGVVYRTDQFYAF
ncbi:LAG1-DNAbind-domain-containing protein [Mucor ambiguus]|uniref:LAG1-DNAbind-domain-containing protein n=1 Tax=Mucor ambiguus TaxID=91626 RepID=A0A0C9LYL1_9FUNG|nr:LAG1-DNAbind-domain-containing protein [Mucor ambiguus]